jgi:hypothetical protein
MKIKNIWNNALHSLFMLSPKYRKMVETEKVFWDNLAYFVQGETLVAPKIGEPSPSKIPTLTLDQVVSYDPTTMVEDFIFPRHPDGKGSKVETLPLTVPTEEEQRIADEVELARTKALYQRLAGIELEKHVEFIQYAKNYPIYKTKTFNDEKAALKFLKEKGFLPHKKEFIEEATLGDHKFIRVINDDVGSYFEDFNQKKPDPTLAPDFDNLSVITARTVEMLNPDEIVELVSPWKPAEAILPTPEEAKAKKDELNDNLLYVHTIPNRPTYKSPFL